MKNIKIKTLAIALCSITFALLGCSAISTSTSTSEYSYRTPENHKKAIEREKEAKEQFNSGQWQPAIENYTAIINFWEREKSETREKRSRLVSLFVGRGDSYKKLNDFKNAESNYFKSLSVIENSSNLAYYEIIMLRFKPALAFSRLYSEKGDYDSAVRKMDDFIKYALSLMPSYTGEYLDTAKIVRKFDRHLSQEWLVYYQAYYYRGLYYYYLKEYKKAAENFKVAVMTSTIHYDPVNDREEPWQVISDTLIKVEGSNPYVKIIRETDRPRNMEVARNDGLNIYRNDSSEKEMICIAGKYTIKARNIDGAQIVSQSTSGNTVTTTYRNVFRAGGVYHKEYNFKAGNVYHVTENDVSIGK